MPLKPMAYDGISPERELLTHNLALPQQLGGPLPPGYRTVWEWMLGMDHLGRPRLSYFDRKKHWRGATQYIGPTALRHPERLAWAFLWTEGNNKVMAGSPRPSDPQERYLEDLRCMWWPVLADTLSSHVPLSPTGNAVPGVCPPQVQNGSDAWWYDLSRVVSARGNPTALPVMQPPPPPVPPPRPVPPPQGHAASSWEIVQTPGPTFEDLDDDASVVLLVADEYGWTNTREPEDAEL